MSEELKQEIERLINLNDALEVAFKAAREERDEAKSESDTYHEWWEASKASNKQLLKEYHDFKFGSRNKWFELNDGEMINLEEWRKSHKCHVAKKPHSETFSFTGNGIGTAVNVQCTACKIKVDLTDMSNW